MSFASVSRCVRHRLSTRGVSETILDVHGGATFDSAIDTVDIRPHCGATHVRAGRRWGPRVRPARANRTRCPARASRRDSHSPAQDPRSRVRHRRHGSPPRASISRSRRRVPRPCLRTAARCEIPCAAVVLQASACDGGGGAPAAVVTLHGPHPVECGDAMVRPGRPRTGGVPAHPASRRPDAAEYVRA